MTTTAYPTAQQSKEKGGTIDALVNYYITKAGYDARGGRLAPEFELAVGGAGEALHEYLAGRTLRADAAFELAIELAGIVSRNPFGAADEVSAALERATRDCSP